MPKISILWLRRDLRLQDNHALSLALNSSLPVLPLFIFDKDILDELPANDARVSFIHRSLSGLKAQLKTEGGDLLVKHGNVKQIWKELIANYDISEVYTNEDYEPYAIQRDKTIQELLLDSGIEWHSCKDQVVFAKDDILKDNGEPYAVFTAYKNKYLRELRPGHIQAYNAKGQWFKHNSLFPALEDIGFRPSTLQTAQVVLTNIPDYDLKRDLPAVDGTTHLGPHLRFGTVSVRQLFRKYLRSNATFISELIWREFFMQILYHYPQVVNCAFKPKYDHILWRNNEGEFKRWCEGRTGYPLVDAGMRELNATGFMHNRVRMVTASFLCKHLLIDWRWGEAYFAEKLLDFDLSANNGNWQWVAGSGCDAAPYFRVFNPSSQQKKFDPKDRYIKKWVKEWNTPDYPSPMVEHAFARQRALDTYAAALKQQ